MPLAINADQRLEEVLLKAHRLFKLYDALKESKQLSSALATFNAAESLLISELLEDSAKQLPANELLETLDKLYVEQNGKLNTLYKPALKYYNDLIDKQNLGQHWKFPPFVKIESCLAFNRLLSDKLQALDKQYKISQQEDRGGLKLSKKARQFWPVWLAMAYMVELTSTFGINLPEQLGSAKASSTALMIQHLKTEKVESPVIDTDVELDREAIFGAKPKLDREPQLLSSLTR